MRFGGAINDDFEKKYFKRVRNLDTHHCMFLEHKKNLKNVVECQKDFFAYFNALETRGVIAFLRSCMIHKY